MIEIKKKKDDGYEFKLKTEEGSTLLKSVKFPNKGQAKIAVKKLVDLKEIDCIYERKTNYEGKFLFDLKNTVGQLIGHSQLYNSEAGMENGMKNLKEELQRL